MKAAVYQGKQRFEVTDIPTPEPGAGQVQIQVHRSAICGTDVHSFMYDLPQVGSVLGHEFAGTISRVGEGVTKWKVGDRVTGGGGDWPVGEAPATRAHPRFNYRTMGFTDTRTRGYAEYTVLEEWAPLPIPDSVPDEAASLTEPCSVGVHAVRRSALRLGDTVGVIGGGPIGLLVTQAALAAGAGQVIVSEPAPARVRAALDSGAAHVVDPFEEDPVERMVELTNGLGPDVVFDCAGLKNTLDQAFLAARRAGQVVLVAVPWEPLPLLPSDWMTREIDFRASWGGSPEDWRISLDLMARGKVNTEVLITEGSLIELEQIQETFEALMSPSVQVQTVFKI